MVTTALCFCLIKEPPKICECEVRSWGVKGDESLLLHFLFTTSQKIHLKVLLVISADWCEETVTKCWNKCSMTCFQLKSHHSRIHILHCAFVLLHFISNNTFSFRNKSIVCNIHTLFQHLYSRLCNQSVIFLIYGKICLENASKNVNVYYTPPDNFQYLFLENKMRIIHNSLHIVLWHFK